MSFHQLEKSSFIRLEDFYTEYLYYDLRNHLRKSQLTSKSLMTSFEKIRLNLFTYRSSNIYFSFFIKINSRN